MLWKRKPAPPPREWSALEQRAAAVIDGFRPFIRADGGEIEFLGVDEGIVKVRLTGACVGCPAASQTLQMGIERHLRERIPEIRAVENVGA